MNEEVKEILDKFKIVIRNDLDYMLRSHNCKVLLDYITNLQNENEHLRTQVNTYENPDDMALFYMWLDAKTKDKIKQLQEENERLKKENTILKENAEHNDKVVDKARWNEMIYKSRCDLAYEYIIRHKRKDGFLNLNEWQTEELLKNIGGKE